VTSYADALPAGEQSAEYAIASRIGLGAEGCLSSAGASDGDGDGLSNLYELAQGLLIGADNSQLDSDGDGLSDLEEALGFTDPLNSDSDDNGFLDGEELDQGTSPPRPREPITRHRPGPPPARPGLGPAARRIDPDGLLVAAATVHGRRLERQT
jgi:hypothetical protein